MDNEVIPREQIFMIINPDIDPTKECINVQDGGNVSEHTPKGAKSGPKTIVQFKSAELFVILAKKDEQDMLPCLVSTSIFQPENDGAGRFCEFFKHHFERFLTNNKSPLGRNLEISNHLFAEYIYENNHNSDMQGLTRFLDNSGLKYDSIKEEQFIHS